MDNFDATLYFRNQYLREAKASDNSSLSSQLSNAIPENTSIEDFATSVSEILMEDYGKHNVGKFMEVLHGKLGINESQEKEMSKLNESKTTISLNDLTFDKLKTAFPKKYQKVSATRPGVGGKQEDMYSDSESVNFPNLSSMSTIISDSALEDWKREFGGKYGNVNIILDPQAGAWFDLVKIDDAEFIKDKEESKDRISSFMR